MLARKEKEISQTLKIKRFKKLLIYLVIISIPLSLFCGLYFGLGGKQSNQNYQLITRNYQLIFQEQNQEALDKNDFTTKGLTNVQDIFQIYQTTSKQDQPYYGSIESVKKASNQVAAYQGVIYGVKVDSFIAGKNNYANWLAIVAFMLIDQQIDGIIYYGN